MLLNKVGRNLVICRNLATNSTFKTCHLVNRSVVRIQGKESADFLQGLMTNDINHLTENHENPAIFAMFLNTQGRVMFDTFITKPNIENDEEFYIDCDKDLSEKLVKHLKMYKVRRKLTIEIQENDHVMAVFHPEENLDQIDRARPGGTPPSNGSVSGCRMTECGSQSSLTSRSPTAFGVLWDNREP